MSFPASTDVEYLKSLLRRYRGKYPAASVAVQVYPRPAAPGPVAVPGHTHCACNAGRLWCCWCGQGLTPWEQKWQDRMVEEPLPTPIPYSEIDFAIVNDDLCP